MEVDIKVSEYLDRLIFTPRLHTEVSAVRAVLSKHNRQARFGRSAEGLWVGSDDVSKLDFQNTPITFGWTELAAKFVQNRLAIKKAMPVSLDEIKSIRHGGPTVAKERLAKHQEFHVLDDHQWVNVACMTVPNGCGLCVFDEQGAGKTVTLIFAFDLLAEQDEVDFALIVAPKSMVSEWPMDFAKFMPGRYMVQTITGNHSEKVKQLSINSDVLVTNFETTVSMERELTAVLRKHGSRAIIVIDESFFAKNLDAMRTRSIRRLREYCGRAFVLCGTPAPNSPVDLVQQFNIVDFGYTFEGVIIPKDKDEAATLIRSIVEEKGPFVRHLKSDVLPDLPPKRFHRVLVTLEPQQSMLYEQTRDDLVSDLKGVDDKQFERNRLSFLARRTALLQICSNPKSISKDYNEIPAKMLAIDRLLEDLIDIRLEKVVLWSFYTATIDALVSRYAKYNPSRYDGTINETSVRRESVRRFRETDQTSLFIGNPAAAGAGLNLQSARISIYESMSNQAAHYLQSLDRIHRRGQTRDVEYIILLCENTIEIKEYDRLIAKEQAAQKVLGDTVAPPITRHALLADLLSD